jgi:shikimate dehydrogenase
MHNAAFAYAGLNWRYVPLPVRPEHLKEAIKGMASLGFRGVNVTVPHKVDIIPLLDTITDAVRVVGAVNTIRVDRNTGKLEGLNTDMTGFLADLAANNVHVSKDTRVIILGAGGASRAVASGVVRSGAQVTLVNRTFATAQSTAAFIQSSWSATNITAVPLDKLAEVARDAALIVNTTSAGMWPDVEATPWPEHVPFPKQATLYDTVYRPLKTRLMRDAEKAGLRVVGGIGMLVYQGAAAYEVWTGKQAPIDVMKMVCQQALTEL